MVERYAPLGHTLQCPVEAPDGGREVSAGQGTGRRFRTRANCLPRKGDDRPTAAVVTRAPFYASERPARAKRDPTEDSGRPSGRMHGRVVLASPGRREALTHRARRTTQRTQVEIGVVRGYPSPPGPGESHKRFLESRPRCPRRLPFAKTREYRPGPEWIGNANHTIRGGTSG